MSDSFFPADSPDDVSADSPADVSAGSWRYSVRSLLLAVLAVALLLGAARMFLFTALTPRGVLIAGIMGIIGTTVGRVAGQSGSPVPKAVLFVVCLLFYAGLAGGHVSPGEPLTMWAFLCASGGMMLGILFPAAELKAA